jgi:hypothetical protein
MTSFRHRVANCFVFSNSALSRRISFRSASVSLSFVVAETTFCAATSKGVFMLPGEFILRCDLCVRVWWDVSIVVSGYIQTDGWAVERKYYPFVTCPMFCCVITPVVVVAAVAATLHVATVVWCVGVSVCRCVGVSHREQTLVRASCRPPSATVQPLPALHHQIPTPITQQPHHTNM